MPNIFINDKNLGPIITVEQLPFIDGTDINKNALYRVYEDGKPALYYYTNIDGLKNWQKAGTGGLEIVKDVASLTEIDPDKIYAVKPRDSFTVEAEDQVGKFCFISKEIEGPSGNFYIITQDPETETIKYKVVLSGLEWTFNSSFSDFANDLYHDHEIRDGVHYSNIIKHLRFANNFPSFKEIKENDIEGGFFYKDMETGEAKYYPVEKSLLVDPPYNSDAFVYDRNWTYFTYDVDNRIWNQIGNPVHEVGIHPYISSSYIENNVYLKGCIFKDMNDKLYTWDSVDGYHLLVKGGGGVTEVDSEADIIADNTAIQYVKDSKQLKYKDADGYKTNLSFHVKSVGALPDNALYDPSDDDCIYYLRKNSLSVPDDINPSLVKIKPGFFKWYGPRVVDGVYYMNTIISENRGISINIGVTGAVNYSFNVTNKADAENFARCIIQDSWAPYHDGGCTYITEYDGSAPFFENPPSVWFNCKHVSKESADVVVMNVHDLDEVNKDETGSFDMPRFGVFSKAGNEGLLEHFEDRPTGYYWRRYDYEYSSDGTFSKRRVGYVPFDFNGIGNGMVPEPPIEIIPGFSMSLATDGEWKYDNYQILDTTTNDAITPDEMLDLLFKNYYHLRDDLWMNTLTIESRLPTNHFEFGFNPKWLKMYTKVYFDHATNVPSMVYQTVVDEVTNCEFERHGKLPTPYTTSDWGQTKEGCVRYTKNSTIEDHDFEDIGLITSELAPCISSLLKHPIKFWVKGVEYYDYNATSRTRPYPAFYSYETQSFLIDVEYEIYVHKNAVNGEAWSEVKRHLYPRGASGKVHDRTVDIYLEGRRKISTNDYLSLFITNNTWETEWRYEQKRVSVANTVFTVDNPWLAKPTEDNNINEIMRYLEDVPIVQYGTAYSFDMPCYVNFGINTASGLSAMRAHAYVTLQSANEKMLAFKVDLVSANNYCEHVIHYFNLNGIISMDGCYPLYTTDSTRKSFPLQATHRVTFKTDYKNIGTNLYNTSSTFTTNFPYGMTMYIKAAGIDYNTFSTMTWNLEYTDNRRLPHTIEVTEYIKADDDNNAYLYVEDTYKVNCKKYVFKKEVNITNYYPSKAIALVLKDMYSGAVWEEEGSGGSGQITNLQIVRCTEAEYTALATKDPNTLYILN